MKRLCSLATVLLALFATPSLADTLWAVNPNSCTPSGSTIAKELLKSGVRGPEFAGDKTGQITLFCPVSGTLTAPFSWSLRMTYQDSTGANTGASVRADLFSIADGEDFTTNALSVNSDSSLIKTLNTLNSPPAIMSFTFADTAYWVRVILKRSKPSQTVRINSIFIVGSDI